MFSVCFCHSTRQSVVTLPCAMAKAHGKVWLFAVCHGKGTRQTRRERRMAVRPLYFAVCQIQHTKIWFCRLLVALNCLPCVAHSKIFTVCPIYDPRQTASLSAAVCYGFFAVCLWHTTDNLCPAVTLVPGWCCSWY